MHWDFVRGEVTIQGETYKLAARRTRGDWCRRVVAAQDVAIPPCSQLDVPTKTVYHQLQTLSNLTQADVSWATETSEIRKGLLIARTLLPNRAVEITVRVLNTSNTSIYLNRGTFVSELHPVTPLEDPQNRPCQQSPEYRARRVRQEQPKKDLLTEKEIVETSCQELMKKFLVMLRRS